MRGRCRPGLRGACVAAARDDRPRRVCGSERYLLWRTPWWPSWRPAGSAERLSRHVRVDELAWQKTRFPGCEVKTLLFDRDSGLVTALMRFAPGAILPDHEHVKIEQTFVLEGKLVDREGPDQGLTVAQGDFVWRPAGSRHSAWCPEGGLMLAMFQVPTNSSSGTAGKPTSPAPTGPSCGGASAPTDAPFVIAGLVQACPGDLVHVGTVRRCSRWPGRRF